MCLFSIRTVSKFSMKGRYYESKHERATINVMSERVVGALDKAQVSYRDSVHIIYALAEEFNIKTDDLILNKTSFHRQRQQIRQKQL